MKLKKKMYRVLDLKRFAAEKKKLQLKCTQDIW